MATSARSSAWKTLIVIIAVVAVAAGGWYFWPRSADEVPDYSTITVARGDVVQVVTATGDIEPVLNVNVSSQISGIISKLYVDWNSPVKEGQVLAQLDPSTYQANVLQAEGQLANAQGQLPADPGQRPSATRELFKKNLVAQSDLDKAEAQLQQADAQVKIQSAALDMAKVNLARCTIYSPIDGVVISRQVDVGNTVAASLSAPTLFMIANDLTKMQIIAAVAEADIGSVAVGQIGQLHRGRLPQPAVQRPVSLIRNSPQTAAERRHLSDDHRCQQSRPQAPPRHDGQCLHCHRRAAQRPPHRQQRAAGAHPGRAAPETRARTRRWHRPAARPPPAAKPMTDQERRAAMFQILQEAGFTRGGGPPSAEVIQKAQQLAKDRGLDLDFSRFAGGGHGRGGGAVNARHSTSVPHPHLPAGRLRPEDRHARSGQGEARHHRRHLHRGGQRPEGRRCPLTGVTLAGSTSSPTEQPTTNPFIGRGGGGRGGRGFDLMLFVGQPSTHAGESVLAASMEDTSVLAASRIGAADAPSGSDQHAVVVVVVMIVMGGSIT